MMRLLLPICFLGFLVVLGSAKEHLQPLKVVAFDLCNKGFPRFVQKFHSLPPFGREEQDPCEDDGQCKSGKCRCLVDGSKQCVNACQGVMCPEEPAGGCFEQAECDPSTGGCFAPRPKTPLSPCDDSNPSTINDRCSASGKCGAGDQDELGGFCGHNSKTSKDMPCGSNTECKTGGCGDEICQHVKEPSIASSCLHRSCAEADEYKVVCKCKDSVCQWRPAGEKLSDSETASAPTESGPSTTAKTAEEVAKAAEPAPATAPLQPGTAPAKEEPAPAPAPAPASK